MEIEKKTSSECRKDKIKKAENWIVSGKKRVVTRPNFSNRMLQKKCDNRLILK